MACDMDGWVNKWYSTHGEMGGPSALERAEKTCKTYV